MQRAEPEQSDEKGPPPSRSGPVDDPRIYLAAERTFLAWVRTAVALMGFGFVIARFAFFLRQYQFLVRGTSPDGTGMSTWVGFGMVCVGVLVCFMAASRHRQYVKDLERGIVNPPLDMRSPLVVAAVVALVGLAIAVHILFL